jgi:outer membrane protein insertion porin family
MLFFSEVEQADGAYGPSAPESGRERITTLYQSRGYLSVNVSVSISEPRISLERGGAVALVSVDIVVVEGARVMFKSVTVAGGVDDVVISDPQEIVGQPVNPKMVNDLVETIGEFYRDRGYLEVEVTGELSIVELGADLRLSVVAGPQTLVRNIVIRGNVATRTEIIEREVTLFVGDPVSLRSIDDTRRALYGLGVFSRVEVSLVGESSFTKDLLVEIVEGPRMSIEVGGGVSTDMGARLFSRVTWNNVRGLGHKVSFMSEVGAGYLGDTWALDMTAPEWRTSLRYEAPKWPVYESGVYADLLLNERVQENSYRLESSGVGLGLQWGTDELAQGAKVQISLAYRAQWRRLHDLDLGVLVVGDPWLETLEIDNLGESGVILPSNARNQTGPELNMFWDSRDDQFNPTSGSYVSFSLRTTDPFGAGYWSYRALTQGRTIVPVGGLSLRISGGAGVGAVAGRVTTLPLEERFWLGGVSTLRGFALDRVGPKNRVGMEPINWPSQIEPLVDELGRDSTSRWVATGGDATLNFTGEVWVPTNALGLSSENGALVGFVDVGNVFFVDPAVLTTSMLIDPEPFLRVGAGVGVRYRTPVGSIQIDLGVNPAWYMTDWADERGEEPLRLHIALGAT